MSSQDTGALVFDGEQRAALACVRSLASHGIAVTVGCALARSLAGSSSAAARVLVTPPAADCVPVFVAWLARALPMIGAAPLLPMTDVTTMVLCHEAEALGLSDDWQRHLASYESLTDKAHLLELAASLEIRVPAGETVTDLAGARLAAAHLGYPVILKPGRSKVRIGDRIVSTAVRLVHSQRELEDSLEAACWFPNVPMIVQRYIHGHGAGIFSLYDQDHAIAWFAHKRLREKPPSGGVSVVSESVKPDTRLQTQADSLLRTAGYRGVSMVEFRIGSDGQPYLMEVNARFWGSLQLAIDAGVDFPWLYYQLLSGDRVAPVTEYEVGRRLRWFLGDVDNLLIQLRDNRLSTSEKAASVKRFFAANFDSRCRQEIFRWSDPGPAWLEARQWLSNAL